jgi:Uncharacterized protein conserved in bacteria (DUF2334)
MHYVILRDDDTCALTPPACLERIYRPFLGRGMPVNLAMIPEVRTDLRTPDGRLEGYLTAGGAPGALLAPIGQGSDLVNYLKAEPGYHIAQHGCHHDLFEFGGSDRNLLAGRLERGAEVLREAGFPQPAAFVAPYDRLSRAAFIEVASRFGVVSTGWFELRSVPVRWWAPYALKKLGKRRHWRAGGGYLLSHPGCLLSFHRPHGGMLASVRRAVEGGTLTVLVSHWWEFFRGGLPDDKLIGVIHEMAEWLASRPDVRVVSFGDVASGRVPVN